MDFKKMVIGFITVFAVALLAGIGVSYLWSLVFHGNALVDWEYSFRTAIVLGIILTIINSRNRLKSEK